jgi:hypothetical protein
LISLAVKGTKKGDVSLPLFIVNSLAGNMKAGPAQKFAGLKPACDLSKP